MSFDEFLELNNRYRLVCEWDDDLEFCDKKSCFIPCYNNKGMIYWNGEDKLSILMFSSPSVPLERLERDVKIKLEPFGELGEYYLEFNPKDIDIIADYFKAKKQALRPIPPHSIRNITTFLRVMQNVHPRYKKKLEEYIDKHRDLEE